MATLFDLGGGAKLNLEVQKKMCRTCPFRGNMVIDPAKVLKDCNDKKIALCHCTHDSQGICCRGYYDKARLTNTTLIWARMLNQIKFVKFNRWGNDEFRLKITMPNLEKTGIKRLQYWLKNFVAIIKGKMQI